MTRMDERPFCDQVLNCTNTPLSLMGTSSSLAITYRALLIGFLSLSERVSASLLLLGFERSNISVKDKVRQPDMCKATCDSHGYTWNTDDAVYCRGWVVLRLLVLDSEALLSSVGSGAGLGRPCLNSAHWGAFQAYFVVGISSVRVPRIWLNPEDETTFI
jgi:hypothetical protein